MSSPYSPPRRARYRPAPDRHRVAVQGLVSLTFVPFLVLVTPASAALRYTIQSVVERDGSYLVTLDGGKTLYLTDGEDAVCSRWSVAEFWETVGDVLEGARRFANAKVHDANAEKQSDGPGPSIHGLATRHVRIKTTYGADARLLILKFRYAVEETDDLWIADDLVLSAFEDAWLRAGALSGFEYTDDMSRQWLSHGSGAVLRWKNLVRLKNLRSGEETVKRREVMVSSLEKIDSASIPAGKFEVPACQQVSREEMERRAKKLLKRHVK